MMTTNNFVALIDDLDLAQGTNEKIRLISDAIDDPSVAYLFNTALSPFVTMGIKQFDTPSEHGTETQLDPFVSLVTSLSSRELTGSAARAEITRVLGLYPQRTSQVLTQVLRQRFDCKVGASLINKAAQRLVVDEYDVMLAAKMSPKFKWVDRAPHGYSHAYFVEWKYDGMRLVAEWLPDDTVIYRSREGLEQDNVPPHITEGLRIAARRIIAAQPDRDWQNGIEFEGEVQADTYSDTMKMMKNTSRDMDRSTLRYFLFDIIPRTAWIERRYDRPFMDRRSDVVCAAHGEYILPSKGQLCANKQDVMDVYAHLVEDGAEGAMIKTVDHRYEWKRSNSWTKFKPVYTADLECYELYEGDELSGFKGTLGGGRLRGYLEDGTYVECDCGSGFKLIRHSSDAEPTRDEIWANPSLALNKVWEVEYQEVSRASDKDVKSLRFVVFKRLRHDKTVVEL